MKIEVSGDELSDIVNALRSKARGDRAAAGTLVPADPAAVQELARTLIRQAERQESLANRLDDSTPTGGGDVGNSACPKCGQRDADQLLLDEEDPDKVTCLTCDHVYRLSPEGKAL